MTSADPTSRQSDGAATTRRRGNGLLSCQPTPSILCLPLGLAGAAAIWFAATFEFVTYPWLLETWSELKRVYGLVPLPQVFFAWQVMCTVAAVMWLVTSLVGLLIRRSWALWIVRKAYAAAYLLAAAYCILVLAVTGRVADAIMADPEAPAGGFLLELLCWRSLWLWPAGGLIVLTAGLHAFSWRRSTVNLYGRQDEDSPAVGDRVIENVRTHGRDPRFRKSAYASAVLHVLVIVVIPYLLMLRGCIRPYRVPLGSGQPTVAMVKVVQPKKKKKRKKYILSKDSPILFDVPELDDSDLVKDVEQATQLTYVADTSAAHGVMGTGGGNTAGWADGFGDGEIRFIRMEYNGQEWDDGMSPEEDADAKFLAEFKRLSGLAGDQVARHGEAHPISHLRKYPKGEAPPFVYMTGSRHIHLTSSDVKTLREYIKEGGMIFADAGDRHWDGPFRGLANSLFPGNPLRPIADDDPIFQIPFTFPNGPPPLWFHGGKQTMGIKYRGRWAVFYFPGDMNDAWKTGHSGLDPVLAEAAAHLGVNVVYYAVTRYLENTREYRK